MRKSNDKHLNIFWSYGGNPNLEDNLTRAFIVTLSCMEKKIQLKIIEELLGENLDLENNFEISYDLQNPYIKNIRDLDCKKYLVGFNPTGKTWGSDLHEIALEKFQEHNFDKKFLDEEGYEKYLLKKFPNLEDKLKEEDENGIKNYEKIKQLILSRLHKGDSRVDGWIFISENNEIKVVIGLETKLWDLDLEQLSNHCEKSIGIKEKDIKYKKFKDVFDYLKEVEKQNNNCIIIRHFLDYMEKVGYYVYTNSFEENDLVYALYNDDYSILKEKFNRFLKSYKKSNYWLELKKYFKEHEIIFNLDSKKIYFKEIGESGIGNIYLDSCFGKENNLMFFVGTEIGVASRWWNEKFSEKLIDNNFINSLKQSYVINKEEYYTKFELFFRINQASFSSYVSSKVSINIEEILQMKKQNCYQGNLTKDQCIEKLKILVIEEEDIFEKLKKRGKSSNANNYNLLSYLRFIDYIEGKHIYGISEEDFNKKFNVILTRHLEGLLEIYKGIKY